MKPSRCVKKTKRISKTKLWRGVRFCLELSFQNIFTFYLQEDTARLRKTQQGKLQEKKWGEEKSRRGYWKSQRTYEGNLICSICAYYHIFCRNLFRLTWENAGFYCIDRTEEKTSHKALRHIHYETCRNKARWIVDSVCVYSPPTLGDLRNSMQRAQSTVGWTSALRKCSFWFAN